MVGGNTMQRVSFYFAPHEDNWQLFMNPSAFQDVIDGDTKSVFIHMTAGDAGLGITSGGRKHPLYLARENGAEIAIRFMADSDNQPPVDKSVSASTFNGGPIRRVSYRNTCHISYASRTAVRQAPVTPTPVSIVETATRRPNRRAYSD